MNILVPGATERLGIDARRQVRRLRGETALVMSFRYPPPYGAYAPASPLWRFVTVELDGEELCAVNAYRHRCTWRTIEPGAHVLRLTGTFEPLLRLELEIEVARQECAVVNVDPGRGAREEDSEGTVTVVVYRDGRKQRSHAASTGAPSA